MLQLLLQKHLYLLTVDAEFLKQKVDNVLGFRHDTGKQMGRFYGLLTISLRCVDSLLDCLLRLNCEFV